MIKSYLWLILLASFAAFTISCAQVDTKNAVPNTPPLDTSPDSGGESTQDSESSKTDTGSGSGSKPEDTGTDEPEDTGTGTEAETDSSSETILECDPECTEGLYCDNGECVDCLENNHCGTGCEECSGETPICLGDTVAQAKCACNASTCILGRYCDETSGQCDDCGNGSANDEHCGSTCRDCSALGLQCNDQGGCACTFRSDCGPGDLGLDCVGGSCVPCTQDERCGMTCLACNNIDATPVCEGGAPDVARCVCTDTSCPGGQFCDAEICKDCIVAEHCGASCNPCPANTPVCIGGSNCGCTGNGDCATDQWCDLLAGTHGQCITCADDDEAHCGPGCNLCEYNVPTCDAGTCGCTGGDCDADEWCNEGLGGAGECTSCTNDDNNHCGFNCDVCQNDTPVCQDGICGCTLASDCTLTQWCDILSGAAGSCVTCTDSDNQHCGSTCADCTGDLGAPTCIGGNCGCATNADCPTGRWCDTSTVATGKCVVCGVDFANNAHCGATCADCGTGTCNAGGNCVCDSIDDCETGYDCISNECSPCNVDTNCGAGCAPCNTSEKPVCSGGEPASAHCVCNDAACTGTGRFCNDSSGSCDDCTYDDNCGNSCEVCSGDTPVCVGISGCGCTANQDCDANEWCDTGTGNGLCTSCGTNEANNEHCGSSCTDCTTQGEGDGFVCNASGSCVCNSDDDCESGHHCNLGACEPCIDDDACGANCIECTGEQPECDGITPGAAKCVCNSTSCQGEATCNPSTGECVTETCADVIASFNFNFDTAGQCSQWTTGQQTGEYCTAANSWQCGDLTHNWPSNAASGSNCLGTNLGGWPTNKECANIVSPEIDLSACAGEDLYLVFKTAANGDDGGGGNCAEGHNVQIFNGTWTAITNNELNPDYPKNAKDNLANMDSNQHMFCGFQYGWATHSFQVPVGYKQAGFKVRFYFTSNTTSSYGGAYVDDVMLTTVAP